MKVLILSCNNGGGHNMIAEAVRQSFCAHGDECVIRDCFSFLTEGLSVMVSRLHDFVYRRAPRFYDAAFRRADARPEALQKHHPARRLIDLGRFRLGRYIREEGFDQVLCIHVFAAMMLTAAKEQYGLRVRTALLETDHRNTAGYAENDVDFHFVPDASLLPGLRAAGVPKSRIVVSGVPVREEIKVTIGKEDARSRLALDPGRPHILLMGGSMGSGPLRELAGLLQHRLGGDVQLTVLRGDLCGQLPRTDKTPAEFLHPGLPPLTEFLCIHFTRIPGESQEPEIRKPGGGGRREHRPEESGADPGK